MRVQNESFLPRLSSEEGELKQNDLSLDTKSASLDPENDPYNIDLDITDGAPVKTQPPSWPYDCDTGACTGQGTYSTSCNGTCHSDCK